VAYINTPIFFVPFEFSKPVYHIVIKIPA
jgi:hypothetical protein